MNARIAPILAGLVIPGAAQIVRGRLFDALLVVASIAGCVGCAIVLASHEIASTAQPASRHILDAPFLSALWALRWPQEVWILLGVGLIIHVTAALAGSDADPAHADAITAPDGADERPDAAAPGSAPPPAPPVEEED